MFEREKNLKNEIDKVKIYETHMTEYYAAVKKNKAVTYVLIWSNLRGVWRKKNSNA